MTTGFTCGTSIHLVPFNHIRSIWQQSKQLLGLHIIMACLLVVVELQIVVFDSGIHWQDNQCNVLTQVQLELVLKSRSIHKILFNFRLTSLQPCLVKALIRTGLNAWLFTEPDPGLEVSIVNTSRKADRSLLPCPLSRLKSRWRSNRYRCRWWNS